MRTVCPASLASGSPRDRPGPRPAKRPPAIGVLREGLATRPRAEEPPSSELAAVDLAMAPSRHTARLPRGPNWHLQNIELRVWRVDFAVQRTGSRTGASRPSQERARHHPSRGPRVGHQASASGYVHWPPSGCTPRANSSDHRHQGGIATRAASPPGRHRHQGGNATWAASERYRRKRAIQNNNTGPSSERTCGGNHSRPGGTRTSRHNGTRAQRGGTITCLAFQDFTTQQHTGPSSATRGEPFPAWHLSGLQQHGPHERASEHTAGTISCLTTRTSHGPSERA
jgi:hypothetical protein